MASVFRQLFCGGAVFVNFVCVVAVFRAPPRCPSHRWHGDQGERLGNRKKGKERRKAMVRVKQDVNNKQQYVNGSIIVWRAYGVGKGKTVTINSSRRGTFSCQNEPFFACSFCKNKKESTLT